MNVQEYFAKIAASCIGEVDIDPSAMIAAMTEAAVSQDSEFLGLIASAALSHFDYLSSNAA